MASIKYYQRGKKRLWNYQIRERGETLAFQSGFPTKREAELEGNPLLNKINQGNSINKNMTLAELYQNYYDLKILSSNRSEQTLKKYRYYKTLIERLFPNEKISKIKPSEYQKKMNLLGQSVSHDVLRRLTVVIHKSIILAQTDKLLVDDFTLGIELFSKIEKQASEEKFIHSEKEYQEILNYLKSKMNYQRSVIPHILYFLFNTGMRYGEAMALTWKEIDWEKQVIKTHQRYNTVIWKFVPSKNKTSIRSVPVNMELLNVLKELQLLQNQFNASLGIINKHHFIFQHYGLKNDVPTVAATNKALKVILKNLNISPLITTKGARHTYGSILLLRGVSREVVAKILGHTDITMLNQVYGHLLKEQADDEFEKIKEMKL